MNRTADRLFGYSYRWSVPKPVGHMVLRVNDGKVDGHGRLVDGPMDFQESEPVGQLFCLETRLDHSPA